MYRNPKKSQYIMPMSNAPIRYNHGHSWECTTIPRSHSSYMPMSNDPIRYSHGHSWECTTIPRSNSICPCPMILSVTAMDIPGNAPQPQEVTVYAHVQCSYPLQPWTFLGMYHNPKKSQYMPMSNDPICYSHAWTFLGMYHNPRKSQHNYAIFISSLYHSTCMYMYNYVLQSQLFMDI